MLYKDYIIELIDRKYHFWTNYYGVIHPINDYDIECLGKPDWKWAAKAERLHYPNKRWAERITLVAETGPIAYDLIKFAIDLHLLNELKCNC